MRQIKLKELELVEFKNHKHLKQEFGVLNVIKGMNGEGKSTIGESVTWVLTGLDMLGSKLDPQPTDREAEKTKASIILEVDGKEIKFCRELVKGKAGFYINDVPKKATEFTEVVYSLTGSDSIDLFLSLFNPSYFPAMHWQDQRNMVLSYVSAPANSEVFKTMPKLQTDTLSKSFKKNNIDDLDAMHKKNVNDKKKEVIAAKSRLDTLQGQLEGIESQDLAKLQLELTEVEKQLKTAEDARVSYSSIKARLINQEQLLKMGLANAEKIRKEFEKAKEDSECQTCAQPLSKEKKNEIIESIRESYREVVKNHKALKAEFESTEVPETPPDVSELTERKMKLSYQIRIEQNRLTALETIEAAKKAVVEVQDSLNESIFLLDAIKEFRGKEADLQAEKVRSLFTSLDIHLWKEPKNGEKTPDFEIVMNGKPYSKLSLGEKARAGAELINVLTLQSEIMVPMFVDNCESITSSMPVETVQTILAYAVPNQKLTVEVDK